MKPSFNTPHRNKLKLAVTLPSTMKRKVHQGNARLAKLQSIAIIKSCGAAGSSVAWIFVGFGACVGMIGSAFGVLLGCIITRNISTIEDWIRIIFGLKLWKSSVYMFSRIPSEVNWFWVIIFVLSAIVAAIIGTLIPAIVAAATKPVEILRYE